MHLLADAFDEVLCHDGTKVERISFRKNKSYFRPNSMPMPPEDWVPVFRNWNDPDVVEARKCYQCVGGLRCVMVGGQCDTCPKREPDTIDIPHEIVEPKQLPEGK